MFYRTDIWIYLYLFKFGVVTIHFYKKSSLSLQNTFSPFLNDSTRLLKVFLTCLTKFPDFWSSNMNFFDIWLTKISTSLHNFSAIIPYMSHFSPKNAMYVREIQCHVLKTLFDQNSRKYTKNDSFLWIFDFFSIKIVQNNSSYESARPTNLWKPLKLRIKIY